MLGAHTLATGLLMALVGIPFLGILLFSGVPSEMILGATIFIGIAGTVIGIVALPYGWLLHKIMIWLRYVSWWEFLFAGICAGVLMALLTQGFLVDTAPEQNGYEEIYEWERAKLFLIHYIKGAFVGVVYAMTYWSTLHRRNHRSA